MALWLYIGGQSAPTASRFRTLYPGEVVNDAQITLAPFVGQGAVFWPTSPGATDPVSVAAAKVFAGRRASARDPVEAQARLLAAIFGSANQQAEGWSGANLFANVTKFTATIGFAQLTAAATTQPISPAGLVLPANARIVSHVLTVGAGFTGGGLSGMSISAGGNGSSNDIIASQSVFVSGSFGGTVGANPTPFYAPATQVSLVFTSTGGNANAATAGSVTLDLLLVLLP